MRQIVLIDTSVFCNLLRVPNRDQDAAEATTELRQLLQDADTSLLLPIGVIYETGNHIAQNGSSGQRRLAAQRLVEQVRLAFAGQAPFTPTPMPLADQLMDWLSEFPNKAEAGVGVTDLSIIELFEEQCALHPNATVHIWAYDGHLNHYLRTPTGSLAR